MKAQALICTEAQTFSLEEVILPDPASDQIAIRTHYTGLSIGTEFALVHNKISWGPYPLCTGYMGTGTVEEVGAEITNFRPGDKVYFRGNNAMTLANGDRVSCVSGAHASHAVLRPNTTHGADHLLPGAPMDVAAMFVMPAVGLYGVDMANPRMGETVVVYGAGLIGLGVIAACVHRGCVVITADVNPAALEIAGQFGADYLIDAAREDVAQAVRRIAPDGADVVFECTGLPELVNPAIALCRTHGAFVWQGNYGSRPVPLEFLPPHGRRLRMFFPCDDGWQPCRRAVVKNMALGYLPWKKTITHRLEAAEAPELFDRINRGDREVIGAVIHWSD